MVGIRRSLNDSNLGLLESKDFARFELNLRSFGCFVFFSCFLLSSKKKNSVNRYDIPKFDNNTYKFYSYGDKVFRQIREVKQKKLRGKRVSILTSPH